MKKKAVFTSVILVAVAVAVFLCFGSCVALDIVNMNPPWRHECWRVKDPCGALDQETLKCTPTMEWTATPLAAIPLAFMLNTEEGPVALGQKLTELATVEKERSGYTKFTGKAGKKYVEIEQEKKFFTPDGWREYLGYRDEIKKRMWAANILKGLRIRPLPGWNATIDAGGEAAHKYEFEFIIRHTECRDCIGDMGLDLEIGIQADSWLKPKNILFSSWKVTEYPEQINWESCKKCKFSMFRGSEYSWPPDFTSKMERDQAAQKSEK